MVDIVSGVTQAIAIASRLREIGKNIEDAEFKNLLADLSIELANAKMKIADQISYNAELKENLQIAESKIHELERDILNGKNKDTDVELKTDALAVLKTLFKAKGLQAKSIAHHLKIEEGIVQYHLDELSDRKLATIGSIITGNPLNNSEGYVKWDITSKGRRIIVENGSLLEP